MTTHPEITRITKRIEAASKETRNAYLERIESPRPRGPARSALGCTNQAHGYAAAGREDKETLRNEEQAPNIGIVSAYNDMVSAHQPLGEYPEIIKRVVRKAGGTALFAGGVPAMCDGVTQGTPGMEFSLFSRDVIAMAAAVALSHDMFDGALYLGVCDKIVPGLLMGALSFGHIPAIFVPGGPMPSGIDNTEKARFRELHAEGLIDQSVLLSTECSSYHAPGTCTFYGTANTNQMIMEVMGLHIPGAAFVNPGTPLRKALTERAGERITQITRLGKAFLPVGRLVNEKSLVNAMVGILATGGSTNLTIHLIAAARVAGIRITWDDFNDLSETVPLITRIYPNGKADVNRFHAVGGMGHLIGCLLDEGLLHENVETVDGRGLSRYRREPFLLGEKLSWKPAPVESRDSTVIATPSAPFSPNGGLKLLTGNLGRAVVKTSAVPESKWVVEAPAIVFHDQSELLGAFREGKLDRDFVAVIKYQGPRANGMPELHKLSPALGVLQKRGFDVALVTDGRMSGASGKVPSAIHVTPECLSDGPLSRVRDGDLICLDCREGTLTAKVEPAVWEKRQVEHPDLSRHHRGMGRELFDPLRKNCRTAEEGASGFGD